MKNRLMWMLPLVVLSGVAALALADGDAEKVDAAGAEAKVDVKAEAAKLQKTPNGQISYALGVATARSLRETETEIDLDAFMRGITDVFDNRELLMTELQMAMRHRARRVRVEALMAKREREAMAARQEQQEKDKAEAAQNKAAAEVFLAENAKAEGVITLPSGLQYKVLQAGTGESPGKMDRVTVHYRGTVLDGTVFDSSYKRKKPNTFRVAGVVKGWQEALQLMKVGSKWQLWIPSSLAYGSARRGAIIGPNSLLVFEVELLAVEKNKHARPQPEQKKTP